MNRKLRITIQTALYIVFLIFVGINIDVITPIEENPLLYVFLSPMAIVLMMDVLNAWLKEMK